MADQAPAHVLEAVGEVDVPRDGVAVGRDPGLGVAAFDQHGTPAGAQGGADDTAYDRRTPEQPGPGLEPDADPLGPRDAADHHGARRACGRTLRESLGARAPAQPS